MKKILIFGSPILIVLEIILFNTITELLTQPSDIAVLVGVLLICISAYLNYLLFNYIKTTFKK